MERNMAIRMTKDVLWQALYKAAMLELEPTKLQNKIEPARAAIQQRVEELTRMTHGGSSVEEQQATDDARRNLRTLQRVEFKLSKPAGMIGKPWADGAEL
jgi:hypothetical protein